MVELGSKGTYVGAIRCSRISRRVARAHNSTASRFHTRPLTSSTSLRNGTNGLSALDAGPPRVQAGPTPGRLSRQGRAQTDREVSLEPHRKRPFRGALSYYSAPKSPAACLHRLPVVHSLCPFDPLAVALARPHPDLLVTAEPVVADPHDGSSQPTAGSEKLPPGRTVRLGGRAQWRGARCRLVSVAGGARPRGGLAPDDRQGHGHLDVDGFRSDPVGGCHTQGTGRHWPVWPELTRQ